MTPTPTPGQMLRYALATAARGWHVFPLVPGGKRPLPGFTAWERHATTDPQLIHRFWTGQPYNIGIACGPSHLVVVDLDVPKDGETPPPPWDQPGVTEGADALALLCETESRPFPCETFTVGTRLGGLHLYFTAPPGMKLANTAGRLGWLIDTRAAGGYVVGPGSHVTAPDGTGAYEVIHAAAPAPLPDWLAVRLVPATPAPATVGITVGDVLAASGIDRTAGYALAALRSEVQRVLTAVPGSRNATLNAAAFALGQLAGSGLLPRHLAEAALQTAGQATDLTSREVSATVRSGIAAGHRQPRRSTA